MPSRLSDVAESGAESPQRSLREVLGSRVGWNILQVLVWIGASLPILLAKYAPLNDLPSHLARFEILQRFGDPFVDAFWVSAWAPLANLGADLLVLGLALFVPTVLAMKLALFVIVGIFGSGFARLREEWSGRRDALALLGYPLVFAVPLTMGFLNYVMGVGLMLWTVALHLRMRGDAFGRYMAIVVPVALATAVSHMVAFAQGLLILSVLELGGVMSRGRLEPRRVPWARLVALTILPAVLLAITPKGNGRGPFYMPPVVGWKIHAFRIAFQSGSAGVDTLLTAGLVIGLALPMIDGERWTQSVASLLGLCLALYLVSPFALYTMNHLDNRQPWVLVTLAFALLAPRSDARIRSGKGWLQALRTATGLGIGLVVVGRTFVITRVYLRRSAELEHLGRDVFGRLPAGSLMLTSYGSYSDFDPNVWEPPLVHAASLGFFYNRLYPNTVFAIRGQQPLGVHPEFEPLLSVPLFLEPQFPAEGIRYYQRLRERLPERWRERSAYLFFVGDDRGAVRGEGAELVAHEGRWGLYRLPPVRSAISVPDSVGQSP